MTGLDWIILGIVILLALFGWAQGFVAGALALIGFAIGAWVGTRVGPLLLPDGRESAWAPATGLIGALVAGAVLAMGFEGVGARLRGRMRTPVGSTVDGLLGAVLTACVGLGIVWVLGAVALQVRRRACAPPVQRSYVLQRLNTVLPPTRRAAEHARPAGSVPAHRRPGGARGARRARRSRATRRSTRPRRSVVKVLGTACGLGVEGSGWVVGDGRRGDQRARRRGAGGHARAAARARARAGRGGDRVRPAQRRRGAARAGARGAGAAARRGPRGSGTVGRRARLPPQRSLRRAGRPAGGDARGGHPGRLRPRAGPALDRLAARARCAPATPAGRWSTAAGAS